MAVELRNVLASSLSLERTPPATVVFDYPSVKELTDYLISTVLRWDAAQETGRKIQGSHGHVASTLERLEQLSDEEVDRLLGERTGEG